jgi:hypothetical protein
MMERWKDQEAAKKRSTEDEGDDVRKGGGQHYPNDGHPECEVQDIPKYCDDVFWWKNQRLGTSGEHKTIEDYAKDTGENLGSFSGHISKEGGSITPEMRDAMGDAGREIRTQPPPESQIKNIFEELFLDIFWDYYVRAVLEDFLAYLGIYPTDEEWDLILDLAFAAMPEILEAHKAALKNGRVDPRMLFKRALLAAAYVVFELCLCSFQDMLDQVVLENSRPLSDFKIQFTNRKTGAIQQATVNKRNHILLYVCNGSDCRDLHWCPAWDELGNYAP